MVSMRDRLTAKQEAFCQNYVVLRNATESAIKAGYSPDYPGTNCDDLLKSTKIQARLAELQAQQAKDPDVANAEERRRVLSAILRARVGEFCDEAGNLAITDREQLKNPAVGEIATERTMMGQKTKLKLRDPIAAIDLLNKMDRLYSEAGTGVTNNVQINIIGYSEGSKESLRRLMAGERTERELPAEESNNE